MGYPYNLGSHSFPVTTNSGDAQAWFDRGLMWCYGFNHEEAISCFHQALMHDAECAMAYWGIAYAGGPNYNKPWEAFDEIDLAKCARETHAASRDASKFALGASELERALIAAMAARCPAQLPAELAGVNDDYAAAMAEVYAGFGSSPDVAALYAESMMNRTAWQLWDLKSGKPAEGADTLRILDVLERGMRSVDQSGAKPHAGLLHFYIHTLEMSPSPQRALKAADTLRGLVPDSGHLQHMPTHIDILCGHYQSAVDWNSHGISADLKHVEREGAANFYAFYRCHNYHFKAYAAMFLGQFGTALTAAREMLASLSEELLRVKSPPMADWLEGFVPTDVHVLIRFGRWEDILALPFPKDPELYSYSTATLRYARAVAYAATGEVEPAEREAALFDADVARVPETRKLMNNFCREILAIAREMMWGEIAYRKGDHEQAFAHLRRSVELDDNMLYDEPWGWMQPTRHALGALLIEQNRVEEAAAVYRADLGLDATLSRSCQHPDNVWSLHGYYECLYRLGREEEARLVKQRFDLANARADVPIRASCFCKLGAR